MAEFVLYSDLNIIRTVREVVYLSGESIKFANGDLLNRELIYQEFGVRDFAKYVI